MRSVLVSRRLCALLAVVALAGASVGCGHKTSNGTTSPATAAASGRAAAREAQRAKARVAATARRRAADRALVLERLRAQRKWEAALRTTTIPSPATTTTTTSTPTTGTSTPTTGTSTTTTGTTTTTTGTTTTSTTTATTAPPTTAPPTRPPPPTTRPSTAGAHITDRRLFLLTDSVMLGAQYALPKALSTWQVNLDGKESRFFPAGLDVLRARRGDIGQVVVIQMGNNYSGNESAFRSDIDQAMGILAGVRWVVFVTVFEFQPDRAEVNNELRAAAARYPNVRLADWNALEHANPGHTSRDGLHLKPSGAVLMAGVVASAVNALPGA